MIDRRALLRASLAMPAVIAAAQLMPLRGIIMPVRRMLEFVDAAGNVLGGTDRVRPVDSMWPGWRVPLSTDFWSDEMICERTGLAVGYRLDAGKDFGVVIGWLGTPCNMAVGNTIRAAPFRLTRDFSGNDHTEIVRS